MNLRPLVFLFVMPIVEAQTEKPNLAEVISKPINVERNRPVSKVPLTLRSGKIYLEAAIQDFQGEFIFDTGSPTVLDQTLAATLELEVVGESTGRDANGKILSMKIAVADSISIGDTTFYDVPVMVHDFSGLPLAECHIPNGVIGSELLPGSVWRMDLSEATLQIASSIDDLPRLEPTYSTSLHLFGYPFAPIVDYSIGGFSDKALFDTGNSSEVALFADIADDRSVRNEIDQQSVKKGQGRLGTSAGGVGEFIPLHTFQLSSFRVGSYEFGPIQVEARPIPPTLIGRGVLKEHTVTLDYPNARFSLSAGRETTSSSPPPGFALSVHQDEVEVTQLFDGSAAQNAGLLLGDAVVAIDGRSLAISTSTERCETSTWLSTEFDAGSVAMLTVRRDDRLKEIVF